MIKNKCMKGRLVKRLTLLLIVILFTGCKFDKNISYPKVQQVQSTKPKNINKVYSNAPLVIDFINYFKVDTNLMADARYITEPLNKNINARLKLDGAITFTKINELFEFNPEIIFLKNKNEKIIKNFSNKKRVIDIQINEDNYFDTVKLEWIKMGVIFNKEKEVKYEIIKIEELKKLISEKLEKKKKKFDIDEYFSNLVKAEKELSKDYPNMDIMELTFSDKNIEVMKEALKNKMMVGAISSYINKLNEYKELINQEDV